MQVLANADVVLVYLFETFHPFITSQKKTVQEMIDVYIQNFPCDTYS